MSSRFEQEMELKLGHLVERGSMGGVMRQEQPQQPQGDSFGFWQFAFVLLALGVAFGWWGGNDQLFSSSYDVVQQYHRCAMQRDDTTYTMHCMKVAGYTFEAKCVSYGHTITSEDDGINKCFVKHDWWYSVKDWWKRAEERRQAREAEKAAAEAAEQAVKAAKVANKATDKATQDLFVQQYRQCQPEADKADKPGAPLSDWDDAMARCAGLGLDYECARERNNAGVKGDDLLRQCVYKVNEADVGWGTPKIAPPLPPGVTVTRVR
jgi:hypothetical protein